MEDEETVIQKQPSFSECRSMMRKRSHRQRGESESAGAYWNVGGCRYRNAKKGRFCKDLAKTGEGYSPSPPAPPCINLCIPKILEYQTRAAK